MGADCSFLAGKPGDPGRPAADNRLFREAVLRIARTVHHLESCLPALPPLDFKGGFESLFEDLYGDPDFEYAIIDGTIVRVRQHGIGAKGARKIRPLASGPKNAWPGHQDRRNVTRLGNLAGFVLPPGERYASAGVAPWIEKIACSAHRHGLRK
jgi:hypothetical protein